MLLTSAATRRLNEPRRFASFIFDAKFYAGLETSFGKSIESELLALYEWKKPEEKTAEENSLKGLPRVEKARRRVNSVWREVDSSRMVGNRRFFLTVKSGPNCINDTQVDNMQEAIAKHHLTWLDQTRRSLPDVRGIDVVVGLTYGTTTTTNNKENQILVKLLEHGFRETKENGVLVSGKNDAVRVYRRIGRDFWALVGSPAAPARGGHTFLEVLLGLALALKQGSLTETMEKMVDHKIDELAVAISSLKLEGQRLPDWVSQTFGAQELSVFIDAVSSFYDGGL